MHEATQNSGILVQNVYILIQNVGKRNPQDDRLINHILRVFVCCFFVFILVKLQQSKVLDGMWSLVGETLTFFWYHVETKWVVDSLRFLSITNTQVCWGHFSQWAKQTARAHTTIVCLNENDECVIHAHCALVNGILPAEGVCLPLEHVIFWHMAASSNLVSVQRDRDWFPSMCM